jgi:hypothetical protein
MFFYVAFIIDTCKIIITREVVKMINSYKIVYKFNDMQGDQVVRALSKEGAKDFFNVNCKRFLGGAFKYIKVLDIIEL